jgi:D-sedoheptulose 7-phosphate isomerase
MNFSVENYILSLNSVLAKVDKEQIKKAISLVKDSFSKEKKIITCGNGGSAYNASHYITDWNKMTNITKKKNFFGFSLCDNVGLITAYSNDIGYDHIFKGQLECILQEDDLLICISGSGNSKNVLNAAEYANSKGATTLAIVGYDGGELINKCKHSVHVPSFDMQICEDVHLIIGHMITKELADFKIN